MMMRIQNLNNEQSNKMDNALDEFVLNMVRLALLKSGRSKKEVANLKREDITLYLAQHNISNLDI
jgi:hypothetical protein